MIVPPMCQNNKCKNFDKYAKETIIKVPKSRNRYLCKECNTEFKWSMPKAPKGAIF